MAKPSIIRVPSALASVTNSTAETTLGTVTLPAFSVKYPHRIKVQAICKTPDTDSTDTFALKLKLGSTVLSTVTAFDAADNDVCFITFEGQIDSANELLHGVAFDGRTGQALANPEPSADVAFDTDTDKVFTVTGQWSVASADNVATLKVFAVELQPLD
jgi:hypothetical protein